MRLCRLQKQWGDVLKGAAGLNGHNLELVRGGRETYIIRNRIREDLNTPNFQYEILFQTKVDLQTVGFLTKIISDISEGNFQEYIYMV